MNTRLRVGTILAGTAVAATSMFGGVASAEIGENLIQNGTFNGFNTKPWITGQGASFAKNWTNEGAVLSNVHKGNLSTRANVIQCVPVPGGAELRLSGRALIEAGQGRDGIGRYGVSFHTSENCGGIGEAPGEDLGVVAGPGSWTSFSADFETSPDAKAVLVILTSEKAAPTAAQSGDDPFRIEFDDVELVVLGQVADEAEADTPPAPEPATEPIEDDSSAPPAPTLAPTEDNTITVATPPPPATGGDNPDHPAEDLSSGEGDSAEVERSSTDDSDGLPMPILGGGLAGLLALVGLGIVLKRAARN